MALQKSFSFTGIKSVSGDGFFIQYGEESVTTGALYIKVTTVAGTKETLSASVSFTDNQSENVVAHKQYEFSLDLEGSNPIRQAYEYLKTLPEFADAVDC